MAIFYLNVQIIGRNAGQSCVAASAYRSGEVLTNEWDGITHDYSRKNWIEHTEIILPENAPMSFDDRSTLWNTVESAEKSNSAQLAREVVVALPIELDFEQQIALVRAYIKENFVSKGMCADFAIHNPPVTDAYGAPLDEDGNRTQERNKMAFRNPHAHILLTMRPMDEKGRWQPKAEKAYICRRGNQQKALRAIDFPEAEAEGWQKQYQYRVGKKKIWLTADVAAQKDLKRISKYPKSEKVQNPTSAEWSSRETLFRWRESWASMCNQALKDNGIDTQIDHRSYEEQGINLVPTVHMGRDAYHAEKKGFRSDRGELNRQIQTDNYFLNQFRKQIQQLEKQEKEHIGQVAAKLEGLRAKHIAVSYQRIALSQMQTKEQDEVRRQLEVATALSESAGQMMAGLEALGNVLQLYQRELARANPLQIQKRKALENKIEETEGQIQNLKQKLSEISLKKKELGKIAPSGSALTKEKQVQMQHLKEQQAQIYKEFYNLVRRNAGYMEKVKELVRGKRSDFDSRTELSLKEHYAEDFQDGILQQARAEALDLLADNGEQLSKNKSKKI